MSVSESIRLIDSFDPRFDSFVVVVSNRRDFCSFTTVLARGGISPVHAGNAHTNTSRRHKDMNHTSKSVRALAATFITFGSLAGGAHAASAIVNVQYYSSGGGGGQSGNASMSGLQGIVASPDSTPYWNRYTAGGYGQISTANAVLYQADDSGGLVDSLVRLTTEITQSSVQDTSSTPLFRGGLYAAPGDPDGTPTITTTLSGLTIGQLYDLHVYAAGTIYNTNTWRYRNSYTNKNKYSNTITNTCRI